MDLAFTQNFQAEPARVVELFRTEAFISDVAEHAGAVGHQVAVGPQATTLDMQLPTPGNLAKIIGKTVDLKMRFAFPPTEAGDVHKGKVNVSVAGMPITVQADAAISPDGDGARGDYSGRLDVKIPLVGKKVEAQVEPFIRHAFDGMERRANHWLTQG
ncbi:MAG TPA: DUF2505 domain-containing protein [Arachnia sp.]|nr:DUF2505 domain-containing protein [Arachnia sp.]HMT87684.1 DUF2505 domain-containing protein [Arachnia sp.]